MDSVLGPRSAFLVLGHARPGLALQVTSGDPEMLADVELMRARSGQANTLPALLLDPSLDTGPVAPAAAMRCLLISTPRATGSSASA